VLTTSAESPFSVAKYPLVKKISYLDLIQGRQMEVRKMGKCEGPLHAASSIPVGSATVDSSGFTEFVSLIYNTNSFFAMCQR
jgi:hypothetical protein